MLRVSNLGVSYGAVKAVDSVSFQFDYGESLAVLGANGAGKTSLLSAVIGLIIPSQGSVFIDDHDMTKKGPEEKLKYGVCLVPERRQVFDALSVEDNLILGAYSCKGVGKSRVAERFGHVYELFPVLKLRRKQAAGTLSGGEQQMLAIGRGLMSAPRLLMVDEPSLGLSPAMVSAVTDSLLRMANEGISLLVVEQNARMAMSLAKQVIVLERGKSVVNGSVDEIRMSDQLRQAYLGV